jgi:transposase
MTLVMGMDQHRAQISAEWIDTITGEISRARVAPADRAGVRKFLTRFKGVGLEVALEATTGWRYVVEELERIGAEVHLAEVVQTAGLKGRGKRPKTDWADARHLRELLLIGRLPESWGVSEEPCKRGRKDEPCPRNLVAGPPIRKMMLLSARSEATPEP